jgi:hypothetical protein
MALHFPRPSNKPDETRRDVTSGWPLQLGVLDHDFPVVVFCDVSSMAGFAREHSGFVSNIDEE